MNSYCTFFFVLLSLTLSGCVTMDQPGCQNADWYAIGLDRGSNGRAEAYIQRYNRVCKEYGIKPDEAQYQQGYISGLSQFCTAEKGYWIGINDLKYQAECPDELRDDFLAGYNKGYRFYRVQQDND